MSVIGRPAAAETGGRVMRVPRVVHLDVTSRCNLRCAYCSFFSSPSEVGVDLPTEEYLGFFRELRELRVMKVVISGGEPLLRRDLPELLAGVVDGRMRFSLNSNGVLMTEAAAKMLADTGRCDGVQISVDGSRAEVHDCFRGKGSFRKAVRAVEMLKAHGVPVTVRMTLHRRNVDELEAAAAFFLEALGLPSFSTNAAGYMGMCAATAADIQLTAAERLRVMKVMERLEERYPGRIAALAGPLAEWRTWRRWHQDGAEGHRDGRGGTLQGCGGVFSSVAVRADGVMVPCSLLPHIELGRINRDDLGVVWRTHPELERLRARRTIPLRMFGGCRDCRYVDFCTGGCPALAYNRTGNDAVPEPSACLSRFICELEGTNPFEL